MTAIVLHCMSLRFTDDPVASIDPWTGEEVRERQLLPVHQPDWDAALEHLATRESLFDAECGAHRYRFGGCHVSVSIEPDLTSPPELFDVTISGDTNSEAGMFVWRVLDAGKLGAYLDKMRLTIGTDVELKNRVPDSFLPFRCCQNADELSECLGEEAREQQRELDSLKRQYGSPWQKRDS